MPKATQAMRPHGASIPDDTADLRNIRDDFYLLLPCPELSTQESGMNSNAIDAQAP